MRFEFDGDLTLDQLSELFEKYGWVYGTADCQGIPDKEALQRQIFRMVTVMEEDDLDYVHNGRLALVRDEEQDNVFQVFLTAGYLYVNEGEEAA